MTLKLLILLATFILLAYGNDGELKDNVESYITKEAAKELRNKLSTHEKQQDYDYDEILKRIIMSVHQPSDENAEQIVYEKKYFDYLPNDLDSEDVTDEDSTQELVKSFGDVMSSEHEIVGDNARRVNSRKFKRDLRSQSRPKRQSIYYAPVPLVRYSPYPDINFYYPHHFQKDFYPAASSIQSSYGNNPWLPQNNPGRFHAPNNFYLPPQPSTNVPFPPRNPPVTNPPMIDTNDRGHFEEDDSDQRVWSIFNKKVDGGSSSSSGSSSSGQRTTLRPQTTTTYRPNSIESNMFDAPNGVVELEIEYPPDTFDEPLTTRAPLKKVSVVPNKTSRRPGPNRQKDREANVTPQSTTSITSTTVRPITMPERSSTSRKVNSKVPTCVLAVVNCCSRYDEIVRTPCFEKYNCNGAFFGSKPCSPETKAAAFREVEKFSRR